MLYDWLSNLCIFYYSRCDGIFCLWNSKLSFNIIDEKIVVKKTFVKPTVVASDKEINVKALYPKYIAKTPKIERKK